MENLSASKVMAVDCGDVRTGVAVSDLTRTLAGHAEVVVTRNSDERLRRVAALAQIHSAGIIAVGLPLNMNNTEGPKADQARRFAENLGELLPDVQIVLWDERVTTLQAHHIMNETNRRGKKRRDTVDALAASLILENYLAFLKNNK